MKARSAKAKGTRLENWVTQFFKSCGWYARRQPGSGIYRDFPHDNAVESPNSALSFNIECKSWKNGWRTGDKAMGQADILVIKRDYGEPRFYLTERAMQDLLDHITELEGGK